jgi:hypothetical protein
MLIEKYSFGTGDRFGKEGKAQLAAIQEINKLGFNVGRRIRRVGKTSRLSSSLKVTSPLNPTTANRLTQRMALCRRRSRFRRAAARQRPIPTRRQSPC